MVNDAIDRPESSQGQHEGNKHLTQQEFPRRSESAQHSCAGCDVTQDAAYECGVFGDGFCQRRVFFDRRVMGNEAFDYVRAKLWIGHRQHIFRFHEAPDLEMKKPLGAACGWSRRKKTGSGPVWLFVFQGVS
jgi:hypothetical protein